MIKLSEVLQILRRQWLVCVVVALVVLLTGSAVVLTRPKAYQSTSSVALLPATTNPNVLPNYPNLIASLIPTYVQLVSSPVLLNEVAATLPFRISESQLSDDVQAESLSNAAIINIVATSPNAFEAEEIALRATSVFLAQLRGNGVVIPKIYGRPTAPAMPVASGTALKLIVVLVFAALLSLAAGLIWDRLFTAARSTGPQGTAGRSPLWDRLFTAARSTGQQGAAGRSPPVAVNSPRGQNDERVASVAGSLPPGHNSQPSERKATRQARSQQDRSRSKRRPTRPSTRQQASGPAEVIETAGLDDARDRARLEKATEPAGSHDNREPAVPQKAGEPAD